MAPKSEVTNDGSGDDRAADGGNGADRHADDDGCKATEDGPYSRRRCSGNYGAPRQVTCRVCQRSERGDNDLKIGKMVDSSDDKARLHRSSRPMREQKSVRVYVDASEDRH